MYRNSVINATDNGAAQTPEIYIEEEDYNTGDYTVYEGQLATFKLIRLGGAPSQRLTVRVKTWEPNREDGFGTNPTEQTHDVTFEPYHTGVVRFQVLAYVDQSPEQGPSNVDDTLKAQVLPGDGRYIVGSPDTVYFDIENPDSTTQAISIQGSPAQTEEGETATFTLTRTGDTTQALTVDVRVDDPQDLLRGNHWDSAPSIPSQVVFPANSTTQTLTLTPPDDQRKLPDGNISVTVLPSDDYLLGELGYETSASVSVTDNDEAQELTFEWGWIDPTDLGWEAGETYLSCSTFPCTPGPAEGIFHYDEPALDVYDQLEIYFPAHFQVTRREEDTGRTATFTVRVEHDRGWVSPRHSDWPVDPVTGKQYFDYPLTLTGDQRTVVGRIEILDNGRPSRWNFSARILPVTESTTGSELTADEEAQYWTLSGQREVSHLVEHVCVTGGEPAGPRPQPGARGGSGGIQCGPQAGLRAGAPDHSGPHLGA